MIETRRSAERGHANHGWLDTHYTFSFADSTAGTPRHVSPRVPSILCAERSPRSALQARSEFTLTSFLPPAQIPPAAGSGRCVRHARGRGRRDAT